MRLRSLIASSAAPRAVALVSGAAFTLSFAPFGWYFLAPLVLAILFRLWEASPREAACRGFAFGLGAFGSGIYWVYHSVRVIGGTPLPVAVLLMGGLIIIMAAYPAACGFLMGRSSRLPRWLRWMAIGPAAWVMTEWLRGWLLSGFPWLTTGYGQIDGPLSAWAPVLGAYGVSLVTAMAAGVMITLVAGPRVDRGLAAAAGLVLVACTWMLSGRSWTDAAGGELRVALVQGAIPQTMKWVPEEQLHTITLYQFLTADLRQQDLIVWPEAAIPAPDDDVPDLLAELSALVRSRHQQLLVGILTHDAVRDEYRNSLLALGDPAGAYHKRHLVPFGEFFPVPGFVRSWMRLMSLPYEDITPGNARQAPLVVAGVKIAPTICYEDIFGGEQRVFLPAAGLLVNVSNDAWFGDSIAPHQHLQMARMRALESGRYMLRSTNTGVTAIIDELGRVRATAPQFRPYVLMGSARPFTGATPYVIVGDLPAVICAFLVLLTAEVVTRRSARRDVPPGS